MEYISVTNVSCAIIIIVFVLFIRQAIKVRYLYKILERANNSDDILDTLTNTKISELKDSYERSICIELTGKKQTNTPAIEFFSEVSTCNAQKINLSKFSRCSFRHISRIRTSRYFSRFNNRNTGL